MEKPSEQMVKAIEKSKIKSIQELLEVLSVEVVYNLLKNYSGLQISIPKFDSFLKAERNEKIKADYFKKGFTYIQLSQKYDLSVRYIRTILFGGEKFGKTK